MLKKRETKIVDKNHKILGGLIWLLVSFNLSAFFLSLAFTTRKDNFSWHPEEPLSYFINSRYFLAVPWVSLAALFLSVGIYVFVKCYLEARDDD